jgi:putative IMPACT (imprinted ancient) family translation regulator
MGSTLYDNETPANIFSSEALVDRKSIFVAHVAEVHSVHEVKVVVAHLLQNKKIAKAAHNILAYRIVLPDHRILQDNDDDGESAAGGKNTRSKKKTNTHIHNNNRSIIPFITNCRC